MNIKYALATLIVSSFLLNYPVLAREITNPQLSATLNNFRQVSLLQMPTLVTPSLVDIDLTSIDSRFHSSLALYNMTSGAFEPFTFVRDRVKMPVSSIFNAEDRGILLSNLSDSNLSTYSEFSVSNPDFNTVRLSVTYPDPISTSSLKLNLDPTSTKPYYVTIRYVSSGGSTENIPNYQILANKRQLIGNGTISFLEVTSRLFEIDLEYIEPLRISEISFIANTLAAESKLRFLAQPNYSYKIYFDPQKNQTVPTGEAPNFTVSAESRVLTGTLLSILPNNTLTALDSDKDGILDSVDNCPFVVNRDQVDIDSNNLGDACEDFDRDGVANSTDNCKDIPNSTQMDKDMDKIGDLCDPDESRLLEKYSWIPWLGIIFGFVAVGVVLVSTKKDLKQSS